MPPHPEISVVLPAFNLGSVIAANIRRTVTALEEVGQPFEVIVVDDGSSDRTLTEAKRVADDDTRVVVVSHRHNQGKGQALITGSEASSGKVVVFLDGDLDLPPEQLGRLLPLLADADVVVGAKKTAMGAGGYPRLRRILSRIYAVVTCRLVGLPVTESQTGLKLFRRDVLDKVLPEVRIRGYAIDLEILARAHRGGFRLVEAPVELDPSAAESSLRLKMMWDLARDTARLMWWIRVQG